MVLNIEHIHLMHDGVLRLLDRHQKKNLCKHLQKKPCSGLRKGSQTQLSKVLFLLVKNAYLLLLCSQSQVLIHIFLFIFSSHYFQIIKGQQLEWLGYTHLHVARGVGSPLSHASVSHKRMVTGSTGHLKKLRVRASLVGEEQCVIKLPRLQPLESVHLLIKAVACGQGKTLHKSYNCYQIQALSFLCRLYVDFKWLLCLVFGCLLGTDFLN